MWRKSYVYCFIILAISLLIACSDARAISNIFIKTRGTTFVRDGKPFYFNGFNAYWLMELASNPLNKNKVTDVFSEASRYGMNVARTWAFSDGGGNRALQISPGNYSENMFRGLDFVMAEAKEYGIYVLLSLVNNWADYGGKKQHVQWARDKGRQLSTEDDFFTDPIVKGFYKNHIKTVLTRVNSITGIAYKDEPTILAWELINEPHCNDHSGKSLQEWIEEMSSHLKSIDKNHLLEVGLEGFYGEHLPDRKRFNPGGIVYGTDFISNNRIAQVDFTTIHVYPEHWIPDSNIEVQAEFVKEWIGAHINDSQAMIGKPLLLTEFGKSSKSVDYTVAARDAYFDNIFMSVFRCAQRGGPCGGALLWQLMAQGMENWSDGYEVVLGQKASSTGIVIYEQSRRISSLDPPP